LIVLSIASNITSVVGSREVAAASAAAALLVGAVFAGFGNLTGAIVITGAIALIFACSIVIVLPDFTGIILGCGVISVNRLVLIPAIRYSESRDWLGLFFGVFSVLMLLVCFAGAWVLVVKI